MIKIIIADDQELIRESMKIILSNASDNYEVIDCVSNGKEVLESIKIQVPDVIFMDIRMPEMDGVTCTRLVKEVYDYINIIVLTTFDDEEFIYNSIKYGASGYLLKGASASELNHAIDTVMEGGSIIAPRAATKAFKLFSNMAKLEKQTSNTLLETVADISDLSETEWSVIEKVSQGYSNKEVSNELYFSEGTVRNYLSVILGKLQFRDRTQVAIWYIQTGEEIHKKCKEQLENEDE